jgi:hypothetical protein
MLRWNEMESIIRASMIEMEGGDLVSMVLRKQTEIETEGGCVDP